MGIRTDRLRKLRESKGWTQQELSIKCGVAKLQIHRYETGITEPTADKLLKFSEIFNVTTDYLIGAIDSPAPYALPQDAGLSDDERLMLETFRRDSWVGVLRIVAERLSKQEISG
jgi:transcriptional regulator with XRE-family HTH domain